MTAARIEITDNMVAAAFEAGHKAQIFADRPKREDIERLIGSVLKLVPASYERERFDLSVHDLRMGVVRARFLCVTEERCYFQVETEQGTVMRVHANDIYPNTLDKPKASPIKSAGR